MAPLSGTVVLMGASTLSPTGNAYVVDVERRNDPDDQRLAFETAFGEAHVNADRSEVGRGVVRLQDGESYVVRCPNGRRDQPEGCVIPLDDTELRGAGTIMADGWGSQTGMHNRAILLLQNPTNVVIDGPTLDGNKLSIGGPDGLARIVYNQGDNGGLHGIAVQGGQNVTIRNVVSSNHLTDGIRIDALHGQGRVLPTRYLIEDSRFDRNRRQGASHIACGRAGEGWDQFVYQRCAFSATGDDEGLPGEAPGANLDIEPNNGGDGNIGATWIDCEFSDSRGSTYEHSRPRGRTRGAGVQFDLRAGMVLTQHRFHNCVSTMNYGDGWFCTTRGAGWSDVIFDGVAAVENGRDAFTVSNHRASEANDGLLRDVVMRALDLPNIVFSDIRPVGHAIQIIRSGERPMVTTNGIQTIEVM